MRPKAEEKENNIVKFEPKIITGGKEPPQGDTWLERLDVGSCFLAQNKNNHTDFTLHLFRLAGWENKAAVIYHADLPGKPQYIDPNRFCNLWRLFSVVAISEEEKGDDNGNGDRVQE